MATGAEKGKKAAETAADVASTAADNGDVDVAAVVASGPDLSAKDIGNKLGNTGLGFLALSVAAYAGAVAYVKFRQVIGQPHISTVVVVDDK